MRLNEGTHGQRTMENGLTSHTDAYMSRISSLVFTASAAVACAVWPSCHKNSALKGAIVN